MVRPLRETDVAFWLALRCELWPFLDDLENAHEADAIRRDDERWAVFVSAGASALDGFIEAHLRDYAEGCDSSPVGFIEGWYVAPQARRSGVGRALVAAAEGWARARGCTEMASDTELENTLSQGAHGALGYVETERLVCFRKPLV